MALPSAYILQKFGPVLEAVVTSTQQDPDLSMEGASAIPSYVAGLAMVDTGASGTSVDISVCQQLGISPTDFQKNAHAGGSEVRPCYPIQVSFPASPLPPIIVHRAMSADLQFGKMPYVLLLGRDFLKRLKFVYNGTAGRIEIAF